MGVALNVELGWSHFHLAWLCLDCSDHLMGSDTEEYTEGYGSVWNYREGKEGEIETQKGREECGTI